MDVIENLAVIALDARRVMPGVRLLSLWQPSKTVQIAMLDFVLQASSGNWDKSTDHYLGSGLSLPAWENLFFRVLGCPEAEPYLEGEDINEYRERYELRFKQAIPDYPMLSRITDYWDDARYELEEVARLREECLKVEKITNDEDVLEGLRELIKACNEAEACKLGLSLVAD